MERLEHAVKSALAGIGLSLTSAASIYGLPALYEEIPFQTRAMIGESLLAVSGQGYNDSGKSISELEKLGDKNPHFPLQLGLTLIGAAGIFVSSYKSIIKNPENRFFSHFD